MAIAVGNVQSVSEGGYCFTIRATNRPAFMVLSYGTQAEAEEGREHVLKAVAKAKSAYLAV
jgi:hypothetical protein